MMRHSLQALVGLSALSIVGAGTASAMDADEVQRLITELREENYAPVESFLQVNRETLGRDPDYYVILLNYVMVKGDLTGVVIAAGEPQPGDLELRDLESDETVGFLGRRGDYDDQLVTDAIVSTRAAQQYFATRLDIRFGIVSAAERIDTTRQSVI